jgi:hypothetical protein
MATFLAQFLSSLLKSFYGTGPSFEKLIAVELVKEFSVLYETRRSIIEFLRTYLRILTSDESS